MRALHAIWILCVTTALADDGVAKRVRQTYEILNTAKFSEAKEACRALAAEYPMDIAVLCMLSHFQIMDFKVADAQATVDRAKAIAPNDARVYNAEAFVLMSTNVGKRKFPDTPWDKVAAALVRATELDPKFTDAWYNLAVARTQQKPPDVQGARAAYKKALEFGAERDPAMEKEIGWKL